MKAHTLTPTVKHTHSRNICCHTCTNPHSSTTTKQLNTQVTACHTLSNVNPSHIALSFKHMLGHADVHASTVPKALYLCRSEQDKEEQDNTGSRTKEDANSEGNL